jgi:hypothetical protein
VRIPWKVIGLAGVAGVAASGAAVARRRRGHQDYDPDDLRSKLHERLAQTHASDPEAPAGAAGSSAPSA